MSNTNELINEVLENIDISPTMEKNARDKYQAISDYLDEQGLESDFIPEGSFLTGTVVRPIKKGKDQNYDLDILCVLREDRDLTTPTKVKNDVGYYLKESEIYRNKLDVENEYCWTLQYADVNPGVGFCLDIVPSVWETTGSTFEKRFYSESPIYSNQIVWITRKIGSEYAWLRSNPIGLGRWFLDISATFLTDEMRIAQWEKMPSEIKTAYNMAEDIPTYFYRSYLQRSVQLLKRHRDIYYERCELSHLQPSSCVLTALIADSVKSKPLLDIVGIVSTFIDEFRSEEISIMVGEKILNPVDPNDDLAKNWDSNQREHLLTWLKKVERDFVLTTTQDEVRKSLYNNIDRNAFPEAFGKPNYVIPTRPWMM